ncbi:lipid II flippase family protein [Roseovarius arcticus]|uniref:lipid II flippase family protein n=1 Tax=Roseovarius arcticus TaxID=2547404 RepID=UPI001486699E|nr:DUF2837 family protein [Roseovarius arcticus]
MALQLTLILLLTFVIHLIGTLAYAFRIAGVQTGHVAIAFSPFNSFVLISRLSNAFQGPLLAKRIELAIADTITSSIRHDFMLILLAASAATIMGGLLLPTFQPLAALAVGFFHRKRSIARLIQRTVSPAGVKTENYPEKNGKIRRILRRHSSCTVWSLYRGIHYTEPFWSFHRCRDPR